MFSRDRQMPQMMPMIRESRSLPETKPLKMRLITRRCRRITSQVDRFLHTAKRIFFPWPMNWSRLMSR